MLQENSSWCQLGTKGSISRIQEHALHEQNRRNQHRLFRRNDSGRKRVSVFINFLTSNLHLYIPKASASHLVHPGAQICNHIRIDQIIRIHKADVLPVCFQNTGISRCRQSLILLCQNADSCIFLLQFPAKLQRSVQRAVIHQNNFESRIGLLLNAANRLPQKSF